MNISKFYTEDYCDYASYDNLRKIASAIDGQKNTARKILYTIIGKNIIQEKKVSQISSAMSEYAQYLHGDASGVVVTMAQNFAGTNNIPLLDREGNFGTRFINEASAPRYIYTNGSKELWEIFNKEDSKILVKQFFEGDEIEPVFYLPNLPMLLINGSEGVSSGFAQKILPRNPELIKKFLSSKLSGQTPKVGQTFTPYFEGFNGTITQGETDKQWIIKGKADVISVAKVKITELPIGYNLKSYIKVLDKLEDAKIITGYKDKSDNDKFEFEVSFLSSNLKTLSDEQLLAKLKLVKTVTENYTCVNEENKIQVFDSAQEIFEYYYSVKIKFLQLRKDFLIEKLDEEIRYDMSKFLFIKGINDNTIIVTKRKRDEITKTLDDIKDILQRDDSYSYLLNMAIDSLTTERMKKLQDDIKGKKLSLDSVKKTALETMWIEELK
jgi:DNA topoisomerase-2